MGNDVETWSEERLAKIRDLIRQLYSVVRKLEEEFEGRRFTPDGHLVGSIGEVIAAYVFGLKLLPASNETHDATAQDGMQVQIKLTGGKKGSTSIVSLNTCLSFSLRTMSLGLCTTVRALRSGSVVAQSKRTGSGLSALPL